MTEVDKMSTTAIARVYSQFYKSSDSTFHFSHMRLMLRIYSSLSDKNSRQFLLCSYHVSDTVRSALLVLVCLILTKCYRAGAILSPLLQRENGNIERLSNLPKVTQLAS